MYFQDDFWEAISTLPQRDRDACAGALLALYFDGEEDTKLRGTARGFYVAFRQRVLIAKARAIAGKKGGKRRSRKLKPEQVQEAIAGGRERRGRHCARLRGLAGSTASKRRSRFKANGEAKAEATSEADCRTGSKPTIQANQRANSKRTYKG